VALQTANVVFLLVHVSDDTVEADKFMVVGGEVIIMIDARNIRQILYFRFPQIISLALTSKESFPSLIN
jgi:hypothetical protein